MVYNAYIQSQVKGVFSMEFLSNFIGWIMFILEIAALIAAYVAGIRMGLVAIRSHENDDEEVTEI